MKKLALEKIIQVSRMIAPVVMGAICVALCIVWPFAFGLHGFMNWTVWILAFMSSGALIMWAIQRVSDSLEQQVSQLTESIQREEQRTLKQQTRFIRNISEDVQSPLLEILAGLRDLIHAVPSGQYETKVRGIYSKCFQLMGSVNDSIELGRPAVSNTSEDRSVNLHQIAVDLSEVYSQALSERPGLIMSFLVDHRIPTALKVDPKRLMHLLGNLIENAITFTHEGQILIKIIAQNPHAPAGSECQIEISCSDSGCGIESTKLESMNAELRGDRDADAGANLGSGIRAAHNIALQMRGGIEIRSEERSGTVVTARLSLPVVSAPREWRGLPESFRFCSTSKELYIALANVGVFHGIHATPIKDPGNPGDGESVFIDAQDLCAGEFGTLDRFEPRDRFVVMIQHEQLRMRQQLLDRGFTRFFMLPLTSTALLECLLEEDVPLTNHTRNVLLKPSRPLSLLVVDDVATTRLRLCQHLESSGHTVVEACDGLEMVLLVNEGKIFDLILCDLTMTHLDGESAMVQVREFEKQHNRRTPIVAMTAYSVLDTQESLKRAGFDAVLQKPVYLDELDYLIGSLVPERPVQAKKETTFIDLADLRRRSAEKIRVMVIVLESFIESSRVQVQDLLELRSKPDQALMLRSLHTLKGLLLEAGAVESAEKLRKFEEKAKEKRALSEREISSIAELVENVCIEASRLKDNLGEPAPRSEKWQVQ